MQKHKYLQVDFCFFFLVFSSHHFFELIINIRTEMMDMLQLRTKEEGQQRERPPSSLKVKGNTSQLV